MLNLRYNIFEVSYYFHHLKSFTDYVATEASHFSDLID